jgi:protein involved in polysaccharide export with SLBB domain
MNAEEAARLVAAGEVLQNINDNINVGGIDRSSVYSVGIELDKALANPGGDFDLVLREGDLLIIPEYINTVKVSGNVMYPNVVTYDPSMTVRDYVEMAGGYGFRTKKSKSYVIYLNGTVKKARRWSKDIIEPGCEIVIPQKREKESNLENVLAISTTAASLGTMIATIGNILR